MTFLFLIAAGIAIGLILYFLGTTNQKTDSDTTGTNTTAYRITSLLNGFTGDIDQDQQHLNQLLSLGTQVLPYLLRDLRISVNEDDPDAYRLASVERMIIDLGLASLPYIVPELARLKNSSRLTAHLVRILKRLSRVDTSAVIGQLTRRPETAWCLFHVLQDRTDMGITRSILACKEGQLPAVLDALAPLLSEKPTVMRAIFEAGTEAQRLALLQSSQRWTPASVCQSVPDVLMDTTYTIQAIALRSTRLSINPDFTPRLRQLASQSHPLQCSALAALIGQNTENEEETLITACQSENPACAALALCALARSAGLAMKAQWKPAHVLPGELAQYFQEQTVIDSWPMEMLFESLESPYTPFHRLVIHLISLRCRSDARARERLIQLAEGAHWQSRVWSILSLAKINDSAAAGLLASTVRSATDDVDLLLLQEAAQHIGEPLIEPLLRRFSSQKHEVAKRILTVIRCMPLGEHSEKLLRILNDIHDAELALQLCHTIRLSGVEGHQVVREVLKLNRPGLVAPALRYLSVYAQRADVTLILTIYDTHRDRRELALSCLEFMGETAVDGLSEHIQQGGDDLTLLTLERRLNILIQCLR